MTETQEQEATALVGWRDKKEKGMPSTGIFVLVGLPKSGKTTLAASFPKAYVLELDRGDADHVAGRIHDIEDRYDADGNLVQDKLTAFRNALKAAVTDPSIETIVMDTLDTLAGLFMDEIAAKNGVASMNVKEKGVNTREMWGELKQKFEGLVGYLNECGKRVVICSHFKAPDKDAEGTVTAPAKLAVPGQSAEYIAGRAKLIGYCYKKETGNEQGYYVSFRGGPFSIWGSRVAELNDKTLKLPHEDPYGAIAEVFEIKTKAIETKTVEIETTKIKSEMGPVTPVTPVKQQPRPKTRKQTAGVN